MENRNKQNGFTLVELVVAMAVLGILVAIGLPSFSEAIKNSRISTQYNNTVGALFIARSEAVKTSGNVTLCARAKDQTQACKQSGGDWSHGMVVFVDNLPVVSDGEITIGEEDTIVHVEPLLEGQNTMKVEGSTNNSASSAKLQPYITYNPNGSTNWRGIAVTVCDSRGAKQARVMNVVLTGDIRRARVSTGKMIPSDTFGREATCP